MRGMSRKNLIVGVSFVGALATLGVAQSMMEKAAAAQGKAAVQAPHFEVDPMWPKPTQEGHGRKRSSASVTIPLSKFPNVAVPANR